MTALLDDLNLKYVGRAPHMRECGLRVTDIGPARGAMCLPARPDWVGDPVRGWLHTGVLTVLADSACGLAVGAAMARRAPYATLDLRMDWLRPAGPDQDVQCEAHCYRISRSVAFVRAEVWQADRAQPVASAQATFMLSTPAGTQRASQLAAGAAPAAASASAPASADPAERVSPSPAPDSADALAPAGSTPVLPDSPIPYLEFLGIRAMPGGEVPEFCLPYQPRLIGNPHLPALHGGAVAAFAETAALLHLVQTLGGTRMPKGIDFSIDYLRAGRPLATFAQCEVVRVGARVALVQVRCWQSAPDKPIVVARGHFLLTEAQAAA